MKNILFDGCSWTQGWGLEGEDKNYERQKKERWSTLVSDYFGTDHVNLSKSGKCNDGILRTTIEYCENNKVDFAVIQFTKSNRREIINYKGVLESDKNYYYQLRSGKNKNDKAAILYYKNLNTQEDNIANFYKNKFLIEFYLKVKKIPYYFIQLNMRENLELPKKFQPSSWQLISDPEPVTCLYDIVGGKGFANTPYLFPYKGSHVGGGPPNTIGGGHPNTEGHRKIADHIIYTLSNKIK